MRYLTGGFNGIDVQRSLDESVRKAISHIEKSYRKDVVSVEDVHAVARVSANWDEETAKIVSDAVNAVGIDGAIYVNDGKGYETTLKVIEGVQFNTRGYLSPYFVTDTARNVVDMDSPYILLFRGKMSDGRALVPLLEQVAKENANLVIVAEGFEPQVLSMLVSNKMQGRLNVVAVKSPWYGDMQLDTMEDLAVMLGTTHIDVSFGKKSMQEYALRDLGRCKRVIVTAKSTAFIEGMGDKEAVAERVEALKHLVDDDEAAFVARENAKTRIKQLQDAVATISVGASTEVEANEKKDRIDDAIRATKAALAEGIVPGGSYCYIKASGILGDKTVGDKILRKAILAPFKKLMENAGRSDEAGTYINDILRSKKEHYGLDVKRMQMVNLYEAGVVDPWLVSKAALLNAASVAGMMLTSDAVVADIPTDAPTIQANNIPVM